MTRSRGHEKTMSLYRAVRTVAIIVFAQAVVATLIVLATSERSIDDFQRVFMTVGGVCAALGILAMGSSRWSLAGEIGAEKMAMARRRPRPVGDLALRRSMFLLIISSALLALIGYGLQPVFGR